MKQIIIFLFSFFIISLQAQHAKVLNTPQYDERFIHFGFSLGVNAYDFNFQRSALSAQNDSLYADVSTLEPGFQVNVVSDMRLGKYFNLRCMPGINFGQRKLNYMKNGVSYNSLRLESNFIDFPILLKYRAKRINNYAPYLITGMSARWDLASRKSYDPENGVYVRLKPFNLYWEVGFGVDYYLYYFKFSTELKFSLGLNDVIVHDINAAPSSKPEYVYAIDRLTSKMIMLSIHFE